MTEPPEVDNNELDLTGEGVSSERVPEPSTIRYNLDQDRERIRGIVALGLIALLAVVIIGSFVVLALRAIPMENLKELLTIVMGPLIALVGAATGFYFGGKTQ